MALAFEGESLLSTLVSEFPAAISGGGVIAAVGGGGKTSTLFALADRMSARGLDVVLTTTTHIRDPRREEGRRFDALIIDRALASPDATPRGRRNPYEIGAAARDGGRRRGAVTVMASAVESEALGSRLVGIHPDTARRLLSSSDAVLVEADGSRMLPVKAPAAHEPAMPASAYMVLGLIGLDCLGRPLDGSTVHRPESFSALTGCGAGEPIVLAHLCSLAEAPSGLFKDAPEGAVRVLVLNKADAVEEGVLENVRSYFKAETPAGVDAVILYSARNDAARMLSRR